MPSKRKSRSRRKRWIAYTTLFLIIVSQLLHFYFSFVQTSGTLDMQYLEGLSPVIGMKTLPPRRHNRALAQGKGKIALMHVGKTGGETLRRYIFAYSCQYLHDETERDQCFENVGEESVLSQHTRGICHFNKQWPGSRYTQRAGNYLFTTRDPISRFESWYRFSSPYNCNLTEGTKIDGCKIRQRIILQGPQSFSARFWKCFPNIGVLAETLDPSFVAPIRNWNRTDCIDLARYAFNTVDGSSDLFHLTANYRHYHGVADLDGHNKSVWAIRLENQWEDAEDVDRAFGGPGNFSRFQLSKYTHGSESLRDRRGLVGLLGPFAMLRVCCALWPDMVAYRDILDRARNLDAVDREETYKITFARCGKGIHNWHDLSQSCSALSLTI